MEEKMGVLLPQAKDSSQELPGVGRGREVFL
jgi:hypothetical protein